MYTDGQTDRQTDTHTPRQQDTQTDRHTDNDEYSIVVVDKPQLSISGYHKEDYAKSVVSYI